MFLTTFQILLGIIVIAGVLELSFLLREGWQRCGRSQVHKRLGGLVKRRVSQFDL